jgi:hypothetical protein
VFWNTAASFRENCRKNFIVVLLRQHPAKFVTESRLLATAKPFVAFAAEGFAAAEFHPAAFRK